MFLSLEYERALESLGYDYFDEVAAAEFPCHHLRFRNDQLLPILGLDPQRVTDADFIQAFGKFVGIRPFLAYAITGISLANIILDWEMVAGFSLVRCGEPMANSMILARKVPGQLLILGGRMVD